MARGFEATGHLLLKPEEVGISDILKLLFSPSFKQKFVNAEGTKEDRYAFYKSETLKSHKHGFFLQAKSSRTYHLKWVITISILLQKFLHLMAKPLLYFGYVLELLLNLVSAIRNGFLRVFYFLRGKRFVPNDERVIFKLEDEGSINNIAALSVMASKASYAKLDDIKTALRDTPKMEFVDSYGFSEEKGKATTDAFILVDRSEDGDTYMLTFRGTEMFNAYEWCTDVDISWQEYGAVYIHAGFLKALGLQNDGVWPEENPENLKKVAYYALRDMLKKALGENEKARLVITGHSLGGALAVLFAATLILHDETLLLMRLSEVYTFGQPRVGDEVFAEYMNAEFSKHGIGYCRVVHSYDVVPRLPFDCNKDTYKHFGICVYYNNRHSKYQIVEHVPLENYFSILMAIPKRLHALMELIRCLFSDGGETVAVASNIVGLAFPGIAAHSINAYVSAVLRSFPSPRELAKLD